MISSGNTLDQGQLKKIKVETGVLKRVFKELESYKKEKIRQEERIAKITSQGADEYDIRKQNEVLQETIVMLPDCEKRLLKAYNSLKELVDPLDKITDAAEIIAAKEAISLYVPPSIITD